MTRVRILCWCINTVGDILEKIVCVHVEGIWSAVARGWNIADYIFQRWLQNISHHTSLYSVTLTFLPSREISFPLLETGQACDYGISDAPWLLRLGPKKWHIFHLAGWITHPGAVNCHGKGLTTPTLPSQEGNQSANVGRPHEEALRLHGKRDSASPQPASPTLIHSSCLTLTMWERLSQNNLASPAQAPNPQQLWEILK